MRLISLQEGWSELPAINREKYQERDGLEGPIMTRSGKVVYYDPKEGAYYDPDTDMYISYDDWRMLDKEGMHMIDMEEGWMDAAKAVASRVGSAVKNLITPSTVKKARQSNSTDSRGSLAKQINMPGFSESEMAEGRMSDQLIHDSETMSKEEFAKKHGKAAAEEYFESSNPAMDKALRRIEKTFSPERQEISNKITVLAQAVEMMTKPQWKDRALDHASQVGVNSVEEIKQELMLLLRDERDLDDEDIDTSLNVRSIERTLEKLASLNEDSTAEEDPYASQTIMDEDPPLGINYDYANLPKVNWDKYSTKAIKEFLSTVENLDFESGYYSDDFDDTHFNAARWIEKNVLAKRQDESVNEVAGPDKCWPGYAPGAQSGVKTKAGTGKNKGKRVNNCEPIKKKK